MLIETITFDIHDFTTGISETFLIENTEENLELVLTTRNSRMIQFTTHQDIDFARNMNIPLSFIRMETWIRLINAKPLLFALCG